MPVGFFSLGGVGSNLAQQHDPEKRAAVFPATNAKRLRGDHAQAINQSAMMTHPNLIAL